MRTEHLGTIDVSDLEALAETYEPPYKRWTKEEEEILRRFHGRVPVEALAKKLNRSLSAIRNKAHEL